MSKMGKSKELFTCRDVLWLLVFCGFAINYMLRLNLNLTIVAMVLPYSKPAAAVQCNIENNTLLWTNETSQNNNVSSSFSITKPSSKNVTYEDRFAWNEYEQGLVLGAYYWLHWLSQLPGGLLARRYGTKLVFGLANLLTALLGFLVPYATHLYAFIILRMLQGLIAGVIWPSMHDMTAKWIPPNERSRFISAYLGSSVGAAITYPLCATVTSFFGWGASFHVMSLLGIMWYCLWKFLVYDSPQQHPRISDDEKNYIMDNIAKSIDKEETQIPWKSIILSGPIWITIVAHWSSAWGFLTLMTQAPTYFNFVHGWNINTTGILAGTPHILRMIFSYFFSIMSDWLLRTKRMSLTNVRKLATFVCTGVQGILIMALGFSGCHPLFAIVFMMTGTAVNGAISAATLTNFVDLSPNYASILLGFGNMIISWAGFISPAIVGVLTNNNQNVGQWRLVFLIAAANSIAGGIIYIFFGTSKEQPWNQYVKLNSKEREMQELATKAIKSDNSIENANDTEKINFSEER
ncbi:putative inorganic phosphate cotransporter isoform X2 [Cataglyphis hispanica]|uniref:putative inorganic phosphate cotransporter isoform X2 n=1 Tax=Cataglyphis hispanica TaxID=1086592 RepID=UPI00217F2CC3|nr:putative inorganic phosphate cotransporter isoform X2 [Cataglyphis hispanica]